MLLNRIVPILLRMFIRGRITPRKLYFLTKNYYLGCIRKSVQRAVCPSVMMIEPTNICNLACTCCALQMDGGCSQETKSSKLEIVLYQKIIDDVKKGLCFLSLYYGGESFIHPQIFDFIQYASSNGISVSIATNGSFSHVKDFGRRVSQVGLDFIIFSISGTVQEVYERLHRKGDLSKVIANIKSVTQMPYSQRPRVIIRYLKTQENRDDAVKLATFVKSVGADTYEVRHIDGTLEIQDSFRHADDPPPKPMDNCFWLWSSLVVKCGGQVIPCCYDYYGVPEIAQLNQNGENVLDVWNGEHLKSFRQKWYKLGSKLDCCSQCHASTGFQDEASKGTEKIVVRKTRLSK